jgi:membrane protease YdiL (CAAX protease family)
VNDSDSQGDYETNLPQEARSEPVLAESAAGEPGAAAPPHGAFALRWRELALLLLFYLIFGAGLAQLAILAASAMLHIEPDALQNIPSVYVAVVAVSQALFSAALLGFLWVLVRSRGTAAFWPSLGWRAFSSQTPHAALAVRFMLGGAALAIVIQVASYFAGTTPEVPMENLFRDRPSVLMMSALGILVAPLVEETLFRGCIYPVIARSFGMPAGIVATGILFGLAHSPQLAGAWKQVALVTIVGMVLTYVRARTGTVLASFLVHLGYNSLLFGTFFIVTRGLQYFPGS